MALSIQCSQGLLPTGDSVFAKMSMCFKLNHNMSTVNCSVRSYLLFACKGTHTPSGLCLDDGHSLIHRFASRGNVLYGGDGSDVDTTHCSSNAIKYALSSSSSLHEN